jgi:hypothetical protein
MLPSGSTEVSTWQGGAGFGRKWFDVPRKDFYAEAILPEGHAVILDLIDPPELLKVRSTSNSS